MFNGDDYNIFSSHYCGGDDIFSYFYDGVYYHKSCWWVMIVSMIVSMIVG